MNNSYEFSFEDIDFSEDRWTINYYTAQNGDYLHFYFDFVKVSRMKDELKEITYFAIKQQRLSMQTLWSYNYRLKVFYEFLDQVYPNITNYNQITIKVIENFYNYLYKRGLSKSSNTVILSALKWLINFGNLLDIGDFPKKDLFRGRPNIFQVEDTLKNNGLTDNVLKQVEEALINEKDVVIKSIIIIFLDTGIRVEELLDLDTGCLSKDFTDRDLLFVYSKKNKTERYIPITKRVTKAINLMIKQLDSYRKSIQSDKLFVNKLKKVEKKSKPIRLMNSLQVRNEIKSFVDRHTILDENNHLAKITPHSFRHNLGTRMINNGFDIYEVQQYLGHNSTHSTATYAKIKNPKVTQQYKKAGFIGLPVNRLDQENLGANKLLDQQTLREAALPDGLCALPINGEGSVCAKFNMCLTCPRFITTPDYLDTHKKHLNELKKDRKSYQQDRLIGTKHHLNEIENALEDVIGQLEELSDE